MEEVFLTWIELLYVCFVGIEGGEREEEEKGVVEALKGNNHHLIRRTHKTPPTIQSVSNWVGSSIVGVTTWAHVFSSVPYLLRSKYHN